MSTFATLMAGIAVPALQRVFGDAATYYSDASGDTWVVTAILDREVVTPLDATGAVEKQTIISLATSDLNGATPRRNDVVTLGSERFIVLSRNRDDGYFTQLVVRPGDD